jgi:hypothetical protein
LFSDEAFEAIHEKTLGVPRKINIFVDRLLLFGFLEELPYFDLEAINEVASEMSGELTGSLSSQVLPNNQTASSLSQQVVLGSSESVENIKDVLREVEEILESNIKQKIKMARYVDKLLKQKNHQYAKEQVSNSNEK